MCASLLVVVGSTSLILRHSESSCTLTASRLWRVIEWSVFITWTVILFGAIAAITATSASFLLPRLKEKTISNPVLGHKFKTYYGTL